ncbi:MAG: dockerin type I repeat-containing protein, partial [Clostridia bacterium]|nr:dockerin type I repeat-containing protein [Clostridia bacterium]
ISGDLSGDGALAVNDVIYLLKNIVGDTELTDEQIALADVSGDGRLTVLDAILLQKLILEVA